MKRIVTGLFVFLFLSVATVWVLLEEDGVWQTELEDPIRPQIGESATGEGQSTIKSTNGKMVAKQKVRLDSPYAKQVDLYRIRYLSEGVQVVGYLSKPRKTEEKLPVIIFNRGGVVEASKIEGVMLEYLTRLSSQGYVVVASQYRGYDGGEGVPEIAGKDVRDVLNLILLADKLPYVDSEKKVMLGFSRGGMVTYLAIKAGARVQAAAVVGGVSDLPCFYEQSGDAFRRPLNQSVGDPLLEAKAYRERSAVKWPEKLKVPLLLIHGLNDRTVSPEQSRRLAEKLTDLGYEHRLVLVPKGSHYLFSHPMKRDREVFRWFERYL